MTKIVLFIKCLLIFGNLFSLTTAQFEELIKFSAYFTDKPDSDQIIIRKEECGGEFSCPKSCSIEWKGACPQTCICLPPTKKRCPELSCSKSPEAACVVYTTPDGCQMCACRAPYTFISYKKRTTPTVKEITPSANSKLVGTADVTTVSGSSAGTTKLFPQAPPRPDLEPHIDEDNGDLNDDSTVAPARLAKTIGRPGSHNAPPAVNEDFLKCSLEHKNEIGTNLGAMDREMGEIGRLSGSSLLFSPLFAFTKYELKKRCQQYQAAYAKTSYQAKRNCFSDYDVYIRIHYAFSYACGWGTEEQFLKSFDCLQSLKFNPEVNKCQLKYQPTADTINNKLQICRMHNDLLSCIHQATVKTCGYEGWLVIYEYLSVNVKSYSRNCRLRRISSTPKSSSHD